MNFLLPALTFLIVVVIALAVFAFSGGGKRESAVRRRLEAIGKGEQRGNASLELKLLRDELLSDLPALHKLMMRWTWSGRLRAYIAQAGLTVKPGKLLLWMAVLGVGGFVGAQIFYLNLFMNVLAGLAAATIPLLYVAVKRSRRLHAFERTLPEAIDLLGRAIRAGHSFTTGLEMIAAELPEPVAGEFRATFDEQNFGLPLRDALLNLAERVPLIDVNFFVTAVLIQKESGGNLAEILDKLSYVIRERFKILGEVRIRTTQGRLTAGILIVLPPSMAFALWILNRAYIEPLFTDPWGPYMLGTAALMQAIGAAMLWKIVHIEV